MILYNVNLNSKIKLIKFMLSINMWLNTPNEIYIKTEEVEDVIIYKNIAIIGEYKKSEKCDVW